MAGIEFGIFCMASKYSVIEPQLHHGSAFYCCEGIFASAPEDSEESTGGVGGTLFKIPKVSD